MLFRSLVARTTPQWNDLDALRHSVALGVVLTAMIGMGQMILPEFAAERFSGQLSAWRARLLGALQVAATMLRVASGLFAGALSPLLLNSVLTLSGLLAFSAVVVFAAFYWRGVRRHRAAIARVAALAASDAAWDMQDRDARTAESR